jgi:hypothetical protein
MLHLQCYRSRIRENSGVGPLAIAPNGHEFGYKTVLAQNQFLRFGLANHPGYLRCGGKYRG